MMGERRVAQEALFYEFSLERHVPADHLLRAIAAWWTCRDSARICGRSAARSVGPRSTPS